MSGCDQHISGMEYVRMNLDTFAAHIRACTELTQLLAIKRQVDDIVTLSRIHPQYKRIYGDIDQRRELINDKWNELYAHVKPILRGKQPVPA